MIVQREVASSQTASSISVWKRACGYSSYWRPMRWHCSKISLAGAYFIVGV
ncbi:MAG: hypothetical protein ACTHN0_00405 [Aquihabitans sp.]